MAFTWNEIKNNEKAQLVRSKLNALGEKMATESQRVDELQNDMNVIKPKIESLDAMVMIAQNISCPVAQWAEDAAKTYENFPYKADLYIAGVTADMVPIVNFAATEQESGNYTGSESTTNVVSIWAKEIPSAALTIPNIVLLKAVNG